MRFQEQIAACHEFDGVRKEKERLTAASLNKNSPLGPSKTHSMVMQLTGKGFTNMKIIISYSFYWLPISFHWFYSL